MTQQVDITQLQTIPLFTQLDISVLEQLAQHCRIRSYTSDQVVFYEGDQLPACLHVLMSGRLRIAKIAASGKETILRLLPAGEIFAAPAVFGNGKAPATVTAIEPASVLTLKKQALLDEFSQTPELALQLLGVFNQRLQQLHNQVHGLASERAIVRLVHYLEYVANQMGTDCIEGGEHIKERLTYYQIARSIGITYEECVRLFKQLQPAVRYRRGGDIVIIDRSILEQQL
ncbi:MAG: Crp/Fnr family transcriptional regulator [Cyanobacteria bacterium P01_H01_bin.21]